MENTDYDIIVVGGGVAGMTAGMYAASSGARTIVLEKETLGGQISLANIVENYPAVVGKPSGPEVAEGMREQAEYFGAEIRTANATSIEAPEDSPVRTVQTSDGPLTAYAVVYAAGAHHRELGVPGERELLGKGVSRCAYCDAFFFRGKDVVVVGGGNSAVTETLHLLHVCNSITLIHRRDELRAEHYLQKRLMQMSENLTFRWNSVVESINGEDEVTSVTIKDVNTGEKDEIPTEGVFIFIGFDPNSAMVKDLLETDEEGLVITDERMKTSVEGIYACGDVRNNFLRQMVVACGEGAIAAVAAQLYVQKLKGQDE